MNVRRRLADAGQPAVESSTDTMIKLALLIDPAARAVRKVHENEVEGVEAANYALISRALFDEKGDAIYPDATFTLRLAFGTIKGYAIDGKAIAAYTTFAGAFAHAKSHNDSPPYRLPSSWVEAKKGWEARARYAVQLRLDRRHHWWQLGKPRGQSSE